MIFDGHSDIFTDVTVRRLKGETQVLKNHHLPRLRKGNIEGGCFVLWIDPPYDADPAKRLGDTCTAGRKRIRKDHVDEYAFGYLSP